MYSSYSAAAFALRAAKPSYNAHSSYLPSHLCHHLDGDSHQRELLPVNPQPSPRFLLDGYLLRHSTHLLLLSARLRPPPPPHPPHCCRRRQAACCYSNAGSGCGRPALEHVPWRLEKSGHRCCGQGTGRSDLGVVCRRLKARGCGCGGSGCGKLYLGTCYGRRDARRLLGRAVRQEVWEYEGGEWSQRRCSMECYGDCGEEEEDECGLARWEVPVRPRIRRWAEEEDGDRCRDCRRWKGVESDYHDEGEYCGRRRERRNVNGIHDRFRDSDQRRLEQRGYNDDEDDTNMRRHKKMMDGRDTRDFEFDGAVAMRRVGAGRYSEDDRRYDRRRERRDFECEDARRDGDGRYAEDGRRFDRRTERIDFESDDKDDVRRKGRHHSNDDKEFLMQSSRRREDREEDVSLLGSRHWHDKDCDDDDYQGIADQKYPSRRRSQRSTLHEDDSQRASSSRIIVDSRLATKGKNAASRVWWHDNVDRQAGQTSEEKYQRSSGYWSNSEKDKYDYNDAQLVRVGDSRTGAQDVKVIIEDDTSLASSSKNTNILKHRSNIDHQVAARKEDSKKSSERIMDTSAFRCDDTELGSTTQSDHREDVRKYIDDKSSSLQSSVKMANDSRRQFDQHGEVDLQVATLTDARTNSEKLTDATINSTHNVNRASLSQRNYDEVNQMDIDDRSTSIENITHIIRDKKRYVNQQVIHETDIDVENVTHVDVSKVHTSDVSMSRSSQDNSEIRSDVNSISSVSLIDSASGGQIHQSKATVSDSAMVKGSQSNLGTGVYDQLHSASVTNVVDCTKEMQEQVKLTKAHNIAAMASTSERHIQKRIDDRFQSSSSVDTAGTLKAHIDTKIHASDTVAVNSSHNSSDNQARRTLSINLVDNARDSHAKSSQQMTRVSSIERNDQLRTELSQSSDDSGEGLTRAEETSRLMQHDVAFNWQQAGTSRISDDRDITSLEMVSGEEASMVDADVEQRGALLGRSETTAGSVPGGVSIRKPVNESLLESAAQLEKSSAFHAEQFVAELQKGVSDAYTTLTKKDEKSIIEDLTSSSRSRMKGPSDEMWDVQSATSLETFKTADKEEVSSAYGGTNSASQTPKKETALARKVHKSLWAYVADIVGLGWIQRGESHDSSNKSVKKSSSSNSQSTEGWLSSQGHDTDDIQKRNGSTKPKDGQLMKSHGGESEPRLASMPKYESLPTGTQSLQISEASNVPEVGRSKGDFVARVSRNDVPISGERAKQSDVGGSPKGNIIGGLAEDSTTTFVGVAAGHSPEHDSATSSRIVTKGSAETNNGKGAQEAGQIGDGGNWSYGPSVAITPYNHPHAHAMMPHENASSSLLRSPELPGSGSTRSEKKIVVQEAPEVIRTEGKDAELKRRKIQRNKQVLKETFDEWEEAYQHDAKQRKADELFMREALLEAQRAADIWEVPVGAVLVHNGEIIARGCNLVEDLRDSTAHAEIVCIREASNKLKTWRLADTTLYVTLEPCAMCAGAILQARVDTVVWGAPNKLLGADGSWVRLFPGDGQTSTLDPANQNQISGPVHPFHPKIIIRRGVLSMECSEIMQQFFQLRRKKKQKPESPPRAHLQGNHHHPIKFFTKMHHMFGTIFCL